MYILTSSFLSLLAEYDIRPPVISSSAISYGIKVEFFWLASVLKNFSYLLL